MSGAETTAPDAARRQADPKTAVVVIHGMGEQRPMDTLRAVVDALWTYDGDITSPRTSTVYSKPDAMTGSFELRRITTRSVRLEEGKAKRADFFEFYWAHLMTGSKIAWVVSWLCGLLIRGPASVPRRLIFPWLAGLFVLVFTACMMALAAFKALPEWLSTLGLPAMPAWVYVLAAVVSFLAGAVGAVWLGPVAGDAARYLSPTPDNVGARQKIREAGVDLLNQLHASGKYDRIIVVGHSLGSVVGYDVLNYAWGRLQAEDLLARHGPGSPTSKALAEVETAAGLLIHAKGKDIGQARVVYRAAQRSYAQALAQAELPPLWLVSDFVTLGCPLSKADVLVARDPEDLRRRVSRREVPTNPPWLEKNDPKQKRFRFSYPVNDPIRIPHHAAVFAPVVWTNVYFDNLLIAFGDIISGAVAPILGRGVLDVRLKISAPVFRHLDYWKSPASDKPWLRALRRAVNLRRLDEATLWGKQAEAAEIEAASLAPGVTL